MLTRPLPGRRNVVVTRQAGWSAQGADRAGSLDEAVALCGGAERAWVIGGADIYAQAMPLADRLEITQIHSNPEGDSVLPPIDPAVWREAARQTHPAGPDDDAAYDFVSYLRANALDPKC